MLRKSILVLAIASALVACSKEAKDTAKPGAGPAQAAALNRLAGNDPAHTHLRERMGHTLVEIAGGVVTGIAMGFAIHTLSLAG